MSYGYGWRPYVSVAKRRRLAAKEIARMKKSGRRVSPVTIGGRKIAKTFWGESWCENLEAYSDYSNRLPRGRTYVRNGSVMDLQVETGRIRAIVNGSSLYDVDIEIKPLSKKRWAGIKKQCAGKIDSMVELLEGSISKGVMEVVTRPGDGLFPAPREISLRCSCPDWATMCKHVAAALYGVGARLDHEPETLFTLRGVEPVEMIAAAIASPPKRRKSGRGRVLKTDDLSSVFGIDLDLSAAADTPKASRPKRRAAKKVTKRTAAKKSTKKVTKRTAAKKAAKKVTKRTATKKTAAKKTATKKTATKKTTKKATKKAAKKTTPRRAARRKTGSPTPKKRAR